MQNIKKLVAWIAYQLTVSGEHGHHGVAAVAHVVAAIDPALGSATRLHHPMEAATAVVLPLTHSHVTRQSARVLSTREK